MLIHGYGFDTKVIIHDMDDDWRYPHDETESSKNPNTGSWLNDCIWMRHDNELRPWNKYEIRLFIFFKKNYFLELQPNQKIANTNRC